MKNQIHFAYLPVGITAFCLIIGLTAQESTKQLTSEQKLKAEIFKLKSQLSNCQLVLEQTNLITEFSQTLEAKPGSKFDWNSLTFTPSVSSTQFKSKSVLEEK